MADCTQRGTHPELKKKYGVRGFPTVVFLDHTGKEVARLRSRSPAAVKSQIEEVVKNHTAKAAAAGTVSEGMTQAKEEKKLLALVFMDNKKGSKKYNDYLKALLLHESFAETKDKFVWVMRPLRDEKGKKTDEAKEFKASRSATVVVVDPNADEKKRILKKLTSPKSLKKSLDKLIKKRS